VHLPVRPIVQSLAAALASWFLGGLVGVVLRLVEPARQAGIAAVTVWLGEGLLGCAFAVGTGLALYLALGWIGSAVHPAFASWRPLLISLLGAIGGVFAYGGPDLPPPPTE